MAKNLQAGEIVKNFSAIVRVEVIEERGALVTIVPWTLNGVAQGGVGGGGGGGGGGDLHTPLYV